MSSAEKEAKYIDCVLEDYKAVKGEISRRSTLQRVALIAYGAIISFILRDGKTYFCADSELKEAALLLVWLSSFITQSFYIVEAFEIKRLGNIITITAYNLKENLRLSPKDAKILFLSETSQTKPKEYENKLSIILRQVFTSLFFAVYFLGVPIYFIYFFELKEKIFFMETYYFTPYYTFIFRSIVLLTCVANFILWITIIFGNNELFRKKIE